MGFVKIPNDLSEWAWYGDNNTLAVYVRLLLGAVWKDRNYQNVHLKRGQIATTIPQIAEQSNLTVQQVRTVLNRLKATGKITVNSTSKFSVITLVEYDCDIVTNSQNNIPLTDEQHTNNRQITDNQQTGNSPSTDHQQPINSQTTDLLIINKKTEGQNVKKTEGTNVSASAPESAESKPKKQRKSVPKKKRYADFVTLTEEEHSKLVEQYGERTVQWCIEKLDNYKGSMGKKYVSDYKAILSWVIKSYQEEQSKHKQPMSSIPPGGMKQEQQSRNPFINAVMGNGGGDNG